MMPFNTDIDTSDGRQLLVQVRIQVDVCVALDTITALPVPSVLPGEVCPAQRDEVGTALTALCITHTPLVEVHRVLTSGDGIPLT